MERVERVELDQGNPDRAFAAWDPADDLGRGTFLDVNHCEQYRVAASGIGVEVGFRHGLQELVGHRLHRVPVTLDAEHVHHGVGEDSWWLAARRPETGP